LIGALEAADLGVWFVFVAALYVALVMIAGPDK
jgi:hypothetical protein